MTVKNGRRWHHNIHCPHGPSHVHTARVTVRTSPRHVLTAVTVSPGPVRGTVMVTRRPQGSLGA